MFLYTVPVLEREIKNTDSLDCRDQVAALVRSHMSGSIPFDRKIERISETMLLALKQ